MSVSPLRLVKNCFEYAPKDDVRYVHANTRGMYVLYEKKTAIGKGRPHFDVVYVGIASGDNAASEVASSATVGVRARSGVISPCSKFGATSARTKSRNSKVYSVTSIGSTRMPIGSTLRGTIKR